MLKKSISFILVFIMVLSISTNAFAESNDYKNHWACDVIEKWMNKEIVKGYGNGIFKPEDHITRAEFAQILVRIFGYTNVDKAKVYTDVNEKDWFYNAVNCISSMEIIHGFNDSTFNPNAKITREEAVFALANAYNVTGKSDKEFLDENKISDWAKEQVNAMVSVGYIKGTPDGYFNPSKPLTRAELVTMIDNITYWLINEAGRYNGEVEGNIIINTSDVTLMNGTIKGNLYLTEGIGEGDVTLEDIIVEGNVYISGGGENKIIINNSVFKQDIIISSKRPIAFMVGDTSKVEGKIIGNVIKEINQINVVDKNGLYVPYAMLYNDNNVLVAKADEKGLCKFIGFDINKEYKCNITNKYNQYEVEASICDIKKEGTNINIILDTKLENTMSGILVDEEGSPICNQEFRIVCYEKNKDYGNVYTYKTDEKGQYKISIKSKDIIVTVEVDGINEDGYCYSSNEIDLRFAEKINAFKNQYLKVKVIDSKGNPISKLMVEIYALEYNTDVNGNKITHQIGKCGRVTSEDGISILGSEYFDYKEDYIIKIDYNGKIIETPFNLIEGKFTAHEFTITIDK